MRSLASALRCGVALLSFSLIVGSCAFVRYSDLAVDDPAAVHARVTGWLDGAAAAEQAGTAVAEWRASLPRGPQSYLAAADDWQGIRARLLALRSNAMVVHEPWGSVSGTLIAEAGESGFGGGFLLVTMGILLVPFDIIGFPFYATGASIRQGKIDDADLVRAVADLQAARELGFADAVVNDGQSLGWPHWQRRQIDAFGYDAEWLAEQPPLAAEPAAAAESDG